MGRNHVVVGIIGSAALLGFYFLVVSLAQSFGHAVQQFTDLSLFIIPLVIGFGAQAGLYSYVRDFSSGSKEMAASGSVSAGSMIACCAHHIVDIVPFLGLTAFALFLSQYQAALISVGVFSNLVGIFIMLGVVQKNRLYSKGFMKSLMKYDMKLFRNIAIAVTLTAVPLMFLAGSIAGTGNTVIVAASSSAALQTIQQSENSVDIDVTPVDFRLGSPVTFEIGLNTHAGSLDFEVDEISALKDDKGRLYSALEWEGSAPGGHHRSGKLTFPPLPVGTKSMTLILKNINDVPERVFEWTL